MVTLKPLTGVPALIDRETGCFTPPEGQLIDYKLSVNFGDMASVSELARDILGFSNSDGGVLVLGVADGDRSIASHIAVDFRAARDTLGYFLGTRVNFDMDPSKNPLPIVWRSSEIAHPKFARCHCRPVANILGDRSNTAGDVFLGRGADQIRAG